MLKTTIKVSFFLVLIVLTILLNANSLTYVSFFAATIHELGHIIAAKILKIKLSEIKFDFLGARLVVSEKILSYRKEILLCFCGPLFNFLSALLIYIICICKGMADPEIKFFIFTSLFLGILNLLPVRTFDGGRITEALLCFVISPTFAKRIIDILSFIIVLFLWLISVYFRLIYSSSLSLFAFSISLFFSLFVTEP